MEPMYASKRRQRNFKRVREQTAKTASTSTNPSKRHRERLNGELETVAQLLPYDPSTINRLDKLSVLRLAVSFLQAKAHFQACLHHSASLLSPLPSFCSHSYPFLPNFGNPAGRKVPTVCFPSSNQPLIDPEEPDFESISLKALGGFVLIINENGEIYYVSENVEQFLGFHQSDILHQPLYELIHSEDRDDIKQQLYVNFGHDNVGVSAIQPDETFIPENLHLLERNVNARFRCLLDNTCGFLRIDMRGKLVSLHGLPSSFVLGRSNPTPVLGLLVVCTPFVPPTSLDDSSILSAEDLILKTKHSLDATLVSMDEKMQKILELSEAELPVSFYQLVHVEDAVCLAEAHKEVIKNGSSGLLIYRMISRKTERLYYAQSSCRMFYKNGKPDSIGMTHRLLNEVEGTMLLEKRSSLKAKLLSFDDSFLQSPRNLQSTAALPLPISGIPKEDQENDGLSQQFPMPVIPDEVRPSSKKKRQNGVILTPTPQIDAAVTSANSDASTSLLFVPPMINQNFPSGTTNRIEPWHLLQNPLLVESLPSEVTATSVNSWQYSNSNPENWSYDEILHHQQYSFPYGSLQNSVPYPPATGDYLPSLTYPANSTGPTLLTAPVFPSAEILPNPAALIEPNMGKEEYAKMPFSISEYYGTSAIPGYFIPHSMGQNPVPPNIPSTSSGFQFISEVTNTLLTPF